MNKRLEKLKDGSLVTFVEKVPILGYVASAGHGLASVVTGDPKDEQRARRAAAACTNSSISTACTTVGGVVGGTLGGPPGFVAGVAAGAAVGSMGGQSAEYGINHAIQREFQTEKGDFGDFRKRDFVGNVCIDTAVSAATAGIWNATGAKDVAKEGSKVAAKKAVGKMGAQGASKIVVEKGVEKAVLNGCENLLTAPIKVAKVGASKILKSASKSKATSAKNAKVDGNDGDSRNVFLCETISDLHRKIDSMERKGRSQLSREEDMIPYPPKFNAPPIPPFTNYLPTPSNPQQTYSMVQPTGTTVTSSIQPSGILSTPNPPGYPINTSVWIPPQQGVQWAGQGSVGRQTPGLLPSQPFQPEDHQVQYQGGQRHNPFYQ